jgi:WD40 repeat protein
MTSTKRRWSKSEKLLLLSPLLILLAWLIAARPSWVMERIFGWPRIIKMPPGTNLRGIALSADGKILAAAGVRDGTDKTGKMGFTKDSGEVHVLDTHSGEIVQKVPASIKRHKNGGWSGFDIYGLALSPDGVLLTRCPNSSVGQLLNLKTGKQIMILPYQFERAVFSSDGKLLAVAHANRITIWDVGSKRIKCVIAAAHKYDLEFSPDGKFLACIKPVTLTVTGTIRKNQNGPMQIWDVATGKLYREFPGESTVALSFSPDGTRLCSVEAGSDSDTSPFFGRIRMCDVKTGRVLWTMEGKEPLQNDVRANDLVFSPNGKIIAFHGQDAGIRLRDVDVGKLLRHLKFPGKHFDSKGVPPALAWSSDGKILASRAKSEVHIWDIKP